MLYIMFINYINLINCWDEEIKNDFGIQNEIGGKYAFLSLKNAVNDLLAKKEAENIQDIAIVRAEQLYPFPQKQFAVCFLWQL